MSAAHHPVPRPKTLTLSVIALVANLAAAGTGQMIQPVAYRGDGSGLSRQAASVRAAPAAWQQHEGGIPTATHDKPPRGGDCHPGVSPRVNRNLELGTRNPDGATFAPCSSFRVYGSDGN